MGEVLCGHSGFQAAAALPQFALVAVQSHLLQGGGGRQRGDVGARGGSWEGKKEKRENAFELLQFLIFSCDSICCRKDQSDRTEDPCESRDPARDTPHLEQQLETSRKQMHPVSVLNSNQ